MVALVALGGCQLAPPYTSPHYVLPEHYQGSEPFTLARPGDALPRGPWWEGFGDPLLNKLEQQLEAENPDLAALAEQYTQARDLAAIARVRPVSAGLRQCGVCPTARSRRTSRSAAQTARRPLIEPGNVIEAGATWEPDFWGRIRSGVTPAEAPRPVERRPRRLRAAQPRGSTGQ